MTKQVIINAPNKPLLSGDNKWWLTDAAPAFAPPIVIFVGSPPKIFILLTTHLSAICWSFRPKFPGMTSSLVLRKPRKQLFSSKPKHYLFHLKFFSAGQIRNLERQINISSYCFNQGVAKKLPYFNSTPHSTSIPLGLVFTVTTDYSNLNSSNETPRSFTKPTKVVLEGPVSNRESIVQWAINFMDTRSVFAKGSTSNNNQDSGEHRERAACGFEISLSDLRVKM